jgi:hypothetical protein
MHRLSLCLPLVLLTAMTATGCSGCDDPSGGVDATPVDGDDPPPDGWPDGGPFSRPTDFPRTDCSPGGFADRSWIPAVYNYRIDYEGPSDYFGSLRIDPVGDRFEALVFGRPGITALVSDDDIVLRVVENRLFAINLCARDGEGVRGSFVWCDDPSAQQCVIYPVEGGRVVPLPEPVATGVTLLGEYGAWDSSTGLTVNVRVAGDLAYLARFGDGLRILDISDPAAIEPLGHVPVAWLDEIWNDVKLADGPEGKRYALMASDFDGVVVIDVTDPNQPSVVRTIPETGDSVHTLFVDGGRVYFTGGRGIEIWDIADPAQPVRLGGHAVGGFVHDLYVSGDRAYLNAWREGMVIVDVSDPASTRVVGVFSGYGQTTSHSSWVTTLGDGRQVAVHGDEQYGAHVHVVDVTEGSPTFARSLGEWETRPAVSVHNVMAFGDRAYISYYQDGLRILDLSNPAEPVEVGHYQTWAGGAPFGQWPYEGAIGVDVDLARDRIYLADTARGLIVLQLDPSR